jgi:DNA-directed RNA polymerase subunit beta'
MAEIDGTVELVKEMKRGKRTILVKNESGVVHEHLVPHGRHLRVQSGDHVKAGTPLTEGPLIPHDILRINGEEALQQYLLREVQNVYRSQGVSIDDKHIEIIVAQMMRKVKVIDPGDSELLPASTISKFQFREFNKKLIKEKKKPINAEPVLLGITKASLQSDSMISAASFQETTKVLTEAAIAGKRDDLLGLKENVILGHMVPTGTGFKEYHTTKIVKNVPEEEEGVEPLDDPESSPSDADIVAS